MGAMLDYIASVMIFGVLVLTVGRIQTNINTTMYQNTFTVTVQGNAVQLARQIEYDMLKMGYHVQGQRIHAASSRWIVWRAARSAGAWDTVRFGYWTGPTSQAAQTFNPRDFPLYRNEDGQTVRQDWGLTDFAITYFDSVDVLLSTPRFSQDSTDRIKVVDVRFTIESSEPVIGPYGDTTWNSVTWQKRLYPRNLGQVNLVK